MVEPDKFVEISVVQYLNECLKTYHAKTLTDTYDPAKTGKRIKHKIIKIPIILFFILSPPLFCISSL